MTDVIAQSPKSEAKQSPVLEGKLARSVKHEAEY
jgi:hypothetical protein